MAGLYVGRRNLNPKSDWFSESQRYYISVDRKDCYNKTKSHVVTVLRDKLI